MKKVLSSIALSAVLLAPASTVSASVLAEVICSYDYELGSYVCVILG